MSQITFNPFGPNEDDDEFRLFDPTRSDFMQSPSGAEIPPPDYCSFVSGTTHPTRRELAHLTTAPESGSLILPTAVPLLSLDPEQSLRRMPTYGQDLVIQSQDRAKHIAVFGPTGLGKNVYVIDMLRFSAIADKTQTVVVFSLKSSDYGPMLRACEAAGRELVVINLNDAWRSVGWNPLETKDPDIANDRIRRFADAVKNPDSKDSEFFTQWIKTGLFGAWVGGHRSFPAMYDLFSTTGDELIEKLRAHGNASSIQLADFLIGQSHNAQTVLASIIGALVSLISENVRRTMSKNEVQFDKLFRQPICLLVEMPETSLETQQVLYQMMARTIMDELINIAELYRDIAPPATIFYDDMPSLGCLLSPNRLLTMRSRRIGIVAGIQSLASLELVYKGQMTKALIDNIHTKIILAGGPASDAQFFSEASGEQLVAMPTYEGQSPSFMNRPLLSSASIRTPNYSHPILGMPATFMVGAITFQAYLQRSYEHPRVAPIIQSAWGITGRERLRKRRIGLLSSPQKSKAPRKRSKPTGNIQLPKGITDTRGWTVDRLKSRLSELRTKLDYENTTGSAKKWWDAFESENQTRLPLIVKLAEELAVRKATIKEFFLAYVYSEVENIQGTLLYLDFARIKNQEEKKKQQKE